jgi:hypothetical protein
MTAVYCIIWAVIAAVLAWGVTTIRASAAISRMQTQMRKEITYWQDETMRARVQAAQIAQDAATWADAWKKGRDDAIAVIPLIVRAHDSRVHLESAANDGTNST